MKEVIAVVRMNMMNRTKQALTDAGINGYFAHEVQGRGVGLANPTCWRARPAATRRPWRFWASAASSTPSA